MSSIGFHSVVLLLSLLAVQAIAGDDRAAAGTDRNWPAWRGPLSTGVAPHADPPLEWSESEGKNIRWRTPLPGRGHSTPIVWDDRVFVTAAVPCGEALKPIYDQAPGSHDNVPVTHRHEFVVLALNRRDGKVLWQRTLIQKLPREGGHHTGSLASNSPVTDGESVFAFFGSRGLYALDFSGEVEWKADLGEMQSLHAHGEGSSPALYGDALIVNWDHEGRSFVVVFDKRSGRERWKKDRGEVTSWATPIVVEHAGKPQVIISGTSRVRSYDLATGRIIWECGGLSSNIVASPVAADGMVYAGSSYDKRALLAIRLDGAEGEITGTDKVAWTRARGTPYVPSPLLYGDALYFLTHYQGILTRVHAKSGADRPGAFRLGDIGNVYASPVGAAGRVYITDLDGVTAVVSHSDAPKTLATNRLADRVSASAAIAGRELFLRGERSLYCIAEEQGSDP
jgi:outer membrane protein assembly factor BamB